MKYDKYKLSEWDRDYHYVGETVIEHFNTKEEIFDFLVQVKKGDDNEIGHMFADYVLIHCIEKNLCKNWPIKDRLMLVKLYNDIGKGYS